MVSLLADLGSARAADPAFWSWAKTPPMGWNSWDCYGAGVWESNVIANSEYMKKHLKGLTQGAQVRDLWQKKDLGAFTDTFAPAINAHGAELFRISPKN